MSVEPLHESSTIIRTQKKVEIIVDMTGMSGKSLGHAEKYVFDYISRMQKQINSNVDEFCQNLKRDFKLLIYQYSSSQKKNIFEQMESSSIEFTQCNLLVKAVIKNELQVLKENEKYFTTLREIDYIFEQERLQTEKVELQVIKHNNLLSQRIQQCLNLQHDVSQQMNNKIKDWEQKLIQANEQQTSSEQTCKTAEQKYDQQEVKYNDQTKDFKILQDQLIKAQIALKDYENVLQQKSDQLVEILQDQQLKAQTTLKATEQKYDQLDVKYNRDVIAQATSKALAGVEISQSQLPILQWCRLIGRGQI